MRNIIFQSILILSLAMLFTSCKVGSGRKNQKNPETREEKLSFYRGQIFSYETDIEYHLKSQMDYNLKIDYENLEETLLSVSSILEKPEQDLIEQIIKNMKTSMEEFKRLKNYMFFNRQNEKLFTDLRKLKKVIQIKEKNNTKVKESPKVEEKGKDK